MRNLSQDDLQKLEEHSVHIISPIPKNQLYRGDSYPVFLAEVGEGIQAHLHFEWLGAEEDVSDSRSHWAQVIETFGSDSSCSDLVQPIFQCVDLGDSCALAVSPAQTLVDRLRNEDSPHGHLKNLVADLAVVMVKLGHSRISLLSIELDDVLVSDIGAIVLSNRAEFCWSSTSLRETRKSGIELIVGFLLRLEEEIPILSAQIQEIRGIALAVSDRNGNGGDLGQLVLALRTGSLLNHQSVTTSASGLQSTSGVKWVRPAKQRVSLARPKLTRVLAVIAVAVMVAVAVIVAIAGFGSRSVETGVGNPLQPPTATEQAKDGVTRASEIQSLLERRASLFTSQNLEDENALRSVYADPVQGAEYIRNSLDTLRQQDIEIEAPEVLVHTIHERSNAPEHTVVEVEYTLTYSVNTGGTETQHSETERVVLKLERAGESLLIVSAESLEETN